MNVSDKSLETLMCFNVFESSILISPKLHLFDKKKKKKKSVIL